MQYIALPSKFTQGIDRLCHNFIWGTTNNKKKFHLVSWSKITKPKKEGSLGLQLAKEKNLALLAKLNWQFHQEKDSPWAKVLAHKYTRRGRLSAFKNRSCSTTWKALSKGKTIFKKGIKWIPSKNSLLSF